MLNRRNRQYLMAGAAIITVACLVLWQATGGDYYTKYEVVEQVDQPVDPDDPLAATGFYEEETQTRTVSREAFRFGLLPTPAGVFDKHGVSVVSIVIPVWLISLSLVWFGRRQDRKRARSNT